MTPADAFRINEAKRLGQPVPADLLGAYLAFRVAGDVAYSRKAITRQAEELRAEHRRTWNGIQVEAHGRRIANHFRFAKLPALAHFNCRCSPAP